MKEIFKQYGDMFIASIIVISLIGIISTMALFGRTGMNAISGEFVDKRLTVCDVSGSFEGTGFDSYKKIKPLNLKVHGGELIYAGEPRRVSDVLTTEYGQKSGYEILQIYDSYGALVSNEVKKPEDNIVFNQPGIYTVYCMSSPARGLEKTVSIKLPVCRR